MKSITQFLVSLAPKRRRVIATVGDLALVETTFAISPAMVGEPDRLHITRKNLLLTRKNLLPPETFSDYITIRTASQISGMRPWKIRKLARQGEIEAMKLGRRWLIVKSSLLEYMKD